MSWYTSDKDRRKIGPSEDFLKNLFLCLLAFLKGLLLKRKNKVVKKRFKKDQKR